MRAPADPKPIKIKTPDEYHGDRSELETFLLQCDLYIWHNQDRFQTENEVMFVVTYLRGKAFKWIQPHLKDYLENTDTDREPETRATFANMESFKEKIRRMFGDIDAERTAERELMGLVQKGSAAAYAAQFQLIAANMSWYDNALNAQYYRGLKESVKDDLVRGERPDELQTMIDASIRIDNRLYERRMEKSGRNAPVAVGRKTLKTPRAHHDPYGLQPMELDATERRQGRFQTKRSPRGAKTPIVGKPFKGKCYNCDRTGHLARDCRQPKKQKQALATTGKAQKKGQLASTQVDHAMMSWTACYDDGCKTHRSDKDGSGWYPKPPRSRQALQVTKKEPSWRTPTSSTAQAVPSDQQTQQRLAWRPTEFQGMQAEVLTTPVTVQSTLSAEGAVSSEEESTEEESGSDISPLDLTEEPREMVPVRDPITGGYPPEVWNQAYSDICELMEDNTTQPEFEEKIRRIKIRLTAYEVRQRSAVSFSELYKEVYNLVLGKPVAATERVRWLGQMLDSMPRPGYRYYDIVREHPPMDCKFTRDGGYVTPEGGYIPRELRQKVTALRQEFAARDPWVNPGRRVDPSEFKYNGTPIPAEDSSSGSSESGN